MRLRGVLKLVDEQMLNPAVESEQELRRCLRVTQRALCGKTELDEIDTTLLGEYNLELGGQAHEHDLQRGQAFPLAVVETRLREGGDCAGARRSGSCAVNVASSARQRCVGRDAGPEPVRFRTPLPPFAVLR